MKRPPGSEQGITNVRLAFAWHRTELPTWRAGAWNLVALTWLVATGRYAWTHGWLAGFLVYLACLVVAGAVGVLVIQRRIDRRADERIAAYLAVRKVQACVAEETERVPA